MREILRVTIMQGTITRRDTIFIPSKDGCGDYRRYKQVDVATRTGFVTLSIDMDGMMSRLGSRALVNVSGKSQVCNGLVFAKRGKYSDKPIASESAG